MLESDHMTIELLCPGVGFTGIIISYRGSAHALGDDISSVGNHRLRLRSSTVPPGACTLLYCNYSVSTVSI